MWRCVNDNVTQSGHLLVSISVGELRDVILHKCGKTDHFVSLDNVKGLLTVDWFTFSMTGPRWILTGQIWIQGGFSSNEMVKGVFLL